MESKSPTKTLLVELSKCQTLKDVLAYTRKISPAWIRGFSDKYCDDYPDLTQTWLTVCKKTNSTPAQIMLVSYIPSMESEASHDQILLHVMDIFALSGFSVRRSKEFIKCHACNALIPAEATCDALKTKPVEWKSYCSMCGPPADTLLSTAYSVVSDAVESLVGNDGDDGDD
jgi:hypothetical protein